MFHARERNCGPRIKGQKVDQPSLSSQIRGGKADGWICTSQVPIGCIHHTQSTWQLPSKQMEPWIGLQIPRGRICWFLGCHFYLVFATGWLENTGAPLDSTLTALYDTSFALSVKFVTQQHGPHTHLRASVRPIRWPRRRTG